MSCIIWLPLTNNITNNGEGDYTFVNNGATVNTNGKIGSCYYFSGSSVRISCTNELSITYPMSIACWVNPSDATNTNTQYMLSYNTSSGGSAGHTIGVGLYQAQLAMWAGGNYYIAAESSTLSNGTWYHLICTISEDNIAKLYVNGNLVKSTTCNAQPESAWFTIGGRSNSSSGGSGGSLYNFKGYINDVRVYDHCLLDNEIKELCKGKMIHYPLSLNGIGIPNLVDNSYDFNGWSVGSGWTKGVSDDGTPMYSFSRSGSTSNNWVRLVPTLRIDGNDYPDGVVVSFDLLTPDVSAIDRTCFVSINKYDETGTRGGWIEPDTSISSLTDNQWTRLSKTFTKAQLIRVNSGYTYSYTKFSFQLVKNGNISIRKIKIEAGSSASRYTMSINDVPDANIEYDVSGYNYHGTKIGEFSYDTNSPKYSLCSVFNKSNCISFPNCNLGNMWSYGVWYRSASLSDAWTALATLNNTGGDADLQLGGYLNQSQSRLQSSANGTYNSQIPLSHDTNWHLYFCTYDGSSMKTYIDAQLVNTTTITNALLARPHLTIGARATNNDITTFIAMFNGNLSDFRLYTTVLSAEYIEYLYQRK